MTELARAKAWTACWALIALILGAGLLLSSRDNPMLGLIVLGLFAFCLGVTWLHTRGKIPAESV